MKSTYLKNFIRNLTSENFFEHYELAIDPYKYIIRGKVSFIYLELNRQTGEHITGNFFDKDLFNKLYKVCQELDCFEN